MTRIKEKEMTSVSKTELRRLKKQAQAYQKLVAKVFELAIKDPIEEVITDFRNTDLYSEDFLSDLEMGLRKSSYTKKHVHKAA